MKRPHTLLLAVLMLLLSAANPVTVAGADASAPARRVIRLSYMKLESGTPAQYESHIRDFWKPIQQDRVDRGELAGWHVYRTFMPQGTASEYDYVLLIEFTSFAHFAQSLDNPTPAPESPATPRPFSVVRLRTETLAVEAATRNWPEGPKQAVIVSFLASLPDKQQDHLRLQREWWCPAHEAMCDAGIASSWATTRVRFPEQRGFPYDVVSFSGYASLAEIEKPLPAAWEEKWGGAKAADTAAKMDAVRTVVRRELWRLVEETRAPAATKRDA